MKTIVIAGGGRRVGKTALAAKLKEILPESAVVKLGTHAPRTDKPVLFLPIGTSFAKVLERVGKPEFLILESGAILDDPELKPSLVIFLPTRDGREDKPGSERRRAKADIVRGEPIAETRAQELCYSLGIERDIFNDIAAAAGAPIVWKRNPPNPI